MMKNNLKNKKIMRRSSKGITLIALVITIIVLLILAGISISMLSGDNSILSRAREAKERTEGSQREEQVKMAILGSYDDHANLDIDKLLSNLNEIKDMTVTPAKENGTNTFPVTVDTGTTTYEIKSDGNFEEVVIADRTGISVGDYITYTSPTTSVIFTDADTGYDEYATTPKTLQAKTLFRVLDIDKYGNMTLIGAMTPEDDAVVFDGAKGYNNAVYTLNKKCSDLYKDISKGITARSIKVEDITDRMIEGTKGETIAESTGKKKIEKYQDEKLTKSLATGTYITNIDTENKTVTYQTKTYYPDIFQYESGGLIDSIQTLGLIGQSESYSRYEGLTTLTNKTPIPTSLTVPDTYYCTSHTVEDFDNTKGNAAAYQNMFFGTGTLYWLASRCISCWSVSASFSVRRVNDVQFDCLGVYASSDNDIGWSNCVCPIVYLPSSVQVEISSNPKNQNNTSGTAHVVK